MKRIISIILTLGLALCLTACGGEKKNATVTELSFSDAVSVEKIVGLNDQPVSIIGYMATISPISGKYMYLMNMPYQQRSLCSRGYLSFEDAPCSADYFRYH